MPHPTLWRPALTVSFWPALFSVVISKLVFASFLVCCNCFRRGVREQRSERAQYEAKLLITGQPQGGSSETLNFALCAHPPGNPYHTSGRSETWDLEFCTVISSPAAVFHQIVATTASSVGCVRLLYRFFVAIIIQSSFGEESSDLQKKRRKWENNFLILVIPLVLWSGCGFMVVISGEPRVYRRL